MYMYNMCIELEDDIFNMIELFARDKTLNAYLYQIGIVEVVCFQMFQPLLESIRIRIEV